MWSRRIRTSIGVDQNFHVLPGETPAGFLRHLRGGEEVKLLNESSGSDVLSVSLLRPVRQKAGRTNKIQLLLGLDPAQLAEGFIDRDER